MKPDLGHYSRPVPAHLLAGVIAPAQEQPRIQNNPVAGQQRNIVSFNRHYNTHGQRQLTALRSVTLKWLLEIVGPLRETANLCMATGTVALQPGRCSNSSLFTCHSHICLCSLPSLARSSLARRQSPPPISFFLISIFSSLILRHARP